MAQQDGWAEFFRRYYSAEDLMVLPAPSPGGQGGSTQRKGEISESRSMLQKEAAGPGSKGRVRTLGRSQEPR